MPVLKTDSIEKLALGVRSGEVRAIARAITLVESREPARLELLAQLAWGRAPRD